MMKNSFQSYLVENRRMIGVLFMATMLLSQAGSAALGVLAVYGP
ncbi:DUF7503 family protein [Haladaptatus halobius]